MENKTTSIVPSQKKGNHTGARSQLKTTSKEEAIRLFDHAKRRLLDINSWQKISGKGSAEFKLTDKKGQVLKSKKPRVGNLIRIKLLAPGNTEGSGFDWVRIETFKHVKDLLKDEEVYGFRVRPVGNPLKQTENSAHFYTSAASSTFLLKRKGRLLSAMEIGRNEVPNNHPDSFFNKIRNVIISIAAMAGLAHPQWKKLVKGILRDTDHPKQIKADKKI